MSFDDHSGTLHKEEPFTRKVPRRAFLFRVTAVVSALAIAPLAAKADCLPSAPAGWLVPFTMATHTNQSNNKDLVSYTTGALTAAYGFFTYSLSSDNNRQLFSNQFVNCGPYCFPYQPFDYTKPNFIGLEISENGLVYPSTIGVTLTLDSWGNTKSSFQGHCDAGSNLLYGSVDNAAMVLISFDTPYNPQVK